jgi:hypothetical protein
LANGFDCGSTDPQALMHSLPGRGVGQHRVVLSRQTKVPVRQTHQAGGLSV